MQQTKHEHGQLMMKPVNKVEVGGLLEQGQRWAAPGGRLIK